MKKLAIFTGIMIGLSRNALADCGMETYGYMGWAGIGIYGVVSALMVALVFSLVFWGTYKLVMKGDKK